MLLIQKNQNNYYAVEYPDLTVEEWSSRFETIPKDVKFMLDKEHKLYNKALESPLFEVKEDENGELIDIVNLELPEPSAESQIIALVENLSLTDNKIIKRVEAILPQLYELLGVNLTEEENNELQDIIEEREGWRNEIRSFNVDVVDDMEISNV
jgi:hypothetical protein